MSAPRFLADESCDFAVVRGLRAAGYDVFAIGEVMNRSVDRELMELAFQERRILRTEDKDFGWLVFVSRAESAGVILIRYPGKLPSTLAQAVVRLVRENAPALSGAFVVMEPNQIRISPRGTAT